MPPILSALLIFGDSLEHCVGCVPFALVSLFAQASLDYDPPILSFPP
jgi:hypothetical protein